MLFGVSSLGRFYALWDPEAGLWTFFREGRKVRSAIGVCEGFGGRSRERDVNAALVEWQFVNLWVPVLLPLVVLWFFSVPNWGNPQIENRIHPFVAVKDGQLAWAALGMCTAALFDLLHPSKFAVIHPDVINLLVWPTVFGMIGCAIIAGLGAVAPTERREARLKALEHIKHYKAFWSSVVLTIIAAIGYNNIHVATQMR